MLDEAFQASPACDWGGEFAGIFREFVEDVRARWPLLEGHVRQGEAEAAGRLAHKFGGAALSFGFRRFAAGMKALQTQARQRVLPEAGALAGWAADFEASVAATLRRWPEAGRGGGA